MHPSAVPNSVLNQLYQLFGGEKQDAINCMCPLYISATCQVPYCVTSQCGWCIAYMTICSSLSRSLLADGESERWLIALSGGL